MLYLIILSLSVEVADDCDTQVATVHSETEGSDVIISDVLSQNPPPTEDIHSLCREQRKVPQLFSMVTYLECGALPNEEQRHEQLYWNRLSSHLWIVLCTR